MTSARAIFVLLTTLTGVAACSSSVPTPPDASSDGSPSNDAPSDVMATDAPPDVVQSDSGGQCGPTWTPTQCGNCGGQSNATSCNQTCDASSCGDGKAYSAVCDLTKGTCDCLIDQVKVCSCTITKPNNPNGCEPEAYGGVMCCWNVG